MLTTPELWVTPRAELLQMLRAMQVDMSNRSIEVADAWLRGVDLASPDIVDRIYVLSDLRAYYLRVALVANKPDFPKTPDVELAKLIDQRFQDRFLVLVRTKVLKNYSDRVVRARLECVMLTALWPESARVFGEEYERRMAAN
jgi:hypothetical protein